MRPAGDAQMGERDVAIFGLRKNGEEFPADSAISMLDVGGTTILAATLRDITERKRFEREQAMLVEVARLLAESFDYEQTLSSVAELAVRTVCDTCVVDLIGPAPADAVRRLCVVSRDGAKAAECEQLAKLPLDRARPDIAASALERKEVTLVEHLSPETLSSLSQSAEHLRLLRALAPTSLIAAPLDAHRNVFGAISFLSSGRPYARADTRSGTALAERAALASKTRGSITPRSARSRRETTSLGVVAHDLRNPLNSIALQAHLLAQQGPGMRAEAQESNVSRVE